MSTQGRWAHSMASGTLMPPLPEPECSRSYLIIRSDTLLLSADACHVRHLAEHYLQ